MPFLLPRKFYLQETKKVAKNLLGKILVRETSQGIMKGKIVETEAYYGEKDPASHASRGKTLRNKIMWEKGGKAYVYFTYGRHFLFNVVTEERGKARAVLLRALEPLSGIEIMKKNRNSEIKNLTNGPGKLTQALGITKKENGLDLTSRDSQLYFITGKNISREKIIPATRIGIKTGTQRKLRFYLQGNEFVSKKARQ